MIFTALHVLTQERNSNLHEEEGAYMSELSENPVKSPSEIAVRVVHGLDDLAKVMAIRSAVWLGEENRPYDEEFDGNDLSATHLLALCDGEPVGTFRLRWFGEFAKLDKLTVRKSYRNLRTLNALVRTAMELCRRKGYRVAYGRAKMNVVTFWKRFGGAPCGIQVSTKRGEAVPMMYQIAQSNAKAAPISRDFLGQDWYDRLVAAPEGSWPDGHLELQRA